MSDPIQSVFSTFAFLGFIISLIPLTWHLQAWNSGTCYYMIWTSLSCLNQFINSIIWAGNAIDSAPIWCDISTRILLGSKVGIPAAALCIVRRMYIISSTQAVTITREEKKRAILIDTLICVLFPIIFIALQFVVQGHRYDIFEDIGCFPALVNSLPTYFLSGIWPIPIGLISAVYCVLSLRAFIHRRSQLSAFLNSSKSLSASRYFRLMSLAVVEIICTTPLAAFVVWLDTTAQPIEPWRGLADAHFNFSRVDQVAAVQWKPVHLLHVSLELTRWSPVICAIVFFGFFGFAAEARRHYRDAFWVVVKPFGLSRPSPHTTLHSSAATRSAPKLRPLQMSSTANLPIYDIKRSNCNSPTSSFSHSISPSTTSSTLDLAHGHPHQQYRQNQVQEPNTPRSAFTVSIIASTGTRDSTFSDSLPPTPFTSSTTSYTHEAGFSPRPTQTQFLHPHTGRVSEESFHSAGAGRSSFYRGPVVM